MSRLTQAPAGAARKLVAGAALAALLAAAAPPAAAHIAYGRPSLAALVADADFVARARIERGDGPVAVGSSGERRPVITARLLQVFKGGPETGRVRFAQHGHGVATFVPGEEVLLFLQAIERSRELAGLAERSDLRWVSLQDEAAEVTLTDASRRAFVDAVRGYVAAQAAASPAAASVAGRNLTFRLLRSPEPQLAQLALREVVARAGDLLSADSLPALEPLLDDPLVAIGVRVGLLAELDRLHLVEGPRRWASLLATTASPDLLAVVRAAGAHPSPQVNRELIRLLGSGNPSIGEAAAIALGVPGNDEAVAPLAEALRDGEPPLPMAVIRGLGQIGTPAALAALAAASDDHPDETVRRRAGAEVRRLRFLSDEAPRG